MHCQVWSINTSTGIIYITGKLAVVLPAGEIKQRKGNSCSFIHNFPAHVSSDFRCYCVIKLGLKYNFTFYI